MPTPPSCYVKDIPEAQECLSCDSMTMLHTGHQVRNHHNGNIRAGYRCSECGNGQYFDVGVSGFDFCGVNETARDVVCDIRDELDKGVTVTLNSETESG